MPRPVVALPCGSRSARRVGRPARASPAARLTAVVVLPTPPFWLTTASVLRRSFSDVSRQTDSDRSARAGGNVRQTLCGRRLFSQGCLAAPRVGGPSSLRCSTSNTGGRGSAARRHPVLSACVIDPEQSRPVGTLYLYPAPQL